MASASIAAALILGGCGSDESSDSTTSTSSTSTSTTSGSTSGSTTTSGTTSKSTGGTTSSTTDGGTSTTKPDGSTTTSTTTPAAATEVRAYLLVGEKVHPVARTARGVGVAKAALEALVAGPTAAESSAGFSSAIPAGTRVLGVNIAGDTATVDLSGEFTSGGGSSSMMGRVAQIVYTATQFPNVTAVQFLIDGKRVDSIGGEGVMVDRPQRRADWEDVTPAILVESPLPGAKVPATFTVSGTSNTFEATYEYRIERPDGTVLKKGYGTATSGTGTRGTYSFQVSGVQGDLVVVLFESSAMDGSEINTFKVPVTAG